MPMLDEELKARLVAMAELDLRVRAALAATGELFEGYHQRMAAIHEENAEHLGRIIDESGWPSSAQVGREGAEAAWLIAQHAISRPEFQRKCLRLLQEASLFGEVPAAQVACLEDRIRVLEGRPQRYGTQFDWDGSGVLNPHPLQDAERVDEHRASVGLGPLADKIQEMRRQAAEEGHEQPGNFEAYLEGRKAWARSVGWL